MTLTRGNNVLKWAIDNGYKCSEYTFSQVAKNNDIILLNSLFIHGCPVDSSAWKRAIEYGHLRILKWLHNHFNAVDVVYCIYAAKFGQLEILKWLHQNNYPMDPYVSAAAAAYGHYEILVWLRSETSCPFKKVASKPDPRYRRIIGINSNSDICRMKNELYNSLVWSTSILTTAAAHGHFKIVRWLHTNECHWDINTCHVAAKNGHLKVLKILAREWLPLE